VGKLASHRSDTSDWTLDSVERLYLEGVSWELYEHLLKVVERSGRRLYLTYDNGELEIMSPLPEHEVPKEAIGRLVEVILEELDLPCGGLGSTTLRRKLEKKGLEPDDCFYVQSQPRIVGKKRINLAKDPPPDLAIEIDITSRSIDRLPIYAALGVPEVWRYDGRKLQCLHLAKDEYRESAFSNAFPKPRVAGLLPFIRIAEEKSDQTAAAKAFRAWLGKESWVKRLPH
jgi:Uma2 family endonuclease